MIEYICIYQIKNYACSVNIDYLLIFVQVHFAEDLTTIYEVGSLKTYFRDRERFQRRIELAEPTLSPVFDASHRRDIFQRNQ